jgi:hypothetical protein
MRAQRQSAQAVTVPAPMGSINTIAPGGLMSPEDCIYRYNMIPAEYGLRVRLGSREWVTGLDGEVRTLLPFTGSYSSVNRLFAVTESGIWDVSSSTTSPTQLVTFATQDETSGHGVFTVMVTAAGHFLLYCDEANGYHVYTETSDTWAKIAMGSGGTEVAGVDPASLVFVTVWKHRVWFVEKNRGKGWYLPTNAIYGTATAYNFGAHFRAGGDLRGLWSLTRDGGGGIDDALVAISGGGDVLVYEGTDPASADTFGLKGVFFVGGVPQGRRIASDFGGDLLVMSTTGLLPLSQLLLGNAAVSAQYATAKIANLWNKLMLSTANLRGWSMALHPLDATLLVLVPVSDGLPTRQLAMSLSSPAKGWSEYRDLNMGTAAVAYAGTLYFGTPDGTVKIMDGYVDGVTLADPNAYSAIQWSLLTAYQNLGTPNQKRLMDVRTTFICEGAPPPYAIEARYRWDVSEIGTSPSDATAPVTALWDTAVWDDANWAPEYSSSQGIRGLTGMGSEVALAVRGTAAARTILVGHDVRFVIGGFW